jgi:uroporphyrinogen-III synthase
MRLLVTRPEPDASRTAELLCERGHTVLVAPVLVTQPVEAHFKSSYDAVLLTSANAARALAKHSRASEFTKLPCFAVGERSAEAARTAGFADVVSADGALPDLVNAVAARFASGSGNLLHIAGEDRAGDLAGELGRRGHAVETVVAYRAVAVPQLPAEPLAALGESQLDGALHYSSRSVAALIRLGEEAGVLRDLRGLAHYCLSDAIARALREAGATRVNVAAHPDETALIALL